MQRRCHTAIVISHSTSCKHTSTCYTSRIWKNVQWTHLLSAVIHKTAQHGDPCVLKQSPGSKTRESRFFSINVQSICKRHNHWATSAPGHVFIVRGTALPESHSPTHSLMTRTIDPLTLTAQSMSVSVQVCPSVCYSSEQHNYLIIYAELGRLDAQCTKSSSINTTWWPYSSSSSSFCYESQFYWL